MITDAPNIEDGTLHPIVKVLYAAGCLSLVVGIVIAFQSYETLGNRETLGLCIAFSSVFFFGFGKVVALLGEIAASVRDRR